MFPRPALRLALVLGLAVPASAAAQRFDYAPGTTTYRVSVKGTGYAEQGTQRQELAFETHQRFTLALTRQGRDTLGYTLTLDSLTGRSAQGAPIDDAEMRGFRVTGRIAPNGRVITRDSLPADKPQLTQVGDEMSRFLPVLPAAMRVGTTWTDTLSAPVSQMGLELERTVVTTYRVTADTTYDGERAWQISRNGTTTVTGSGAVMGQVVSVEGGSTGEGRIYVSRSGHYLGGHGQDEVKSVVTLIAQGLEVTNVQSLTTEVARVR